MPPEFFEHCEKNKIPVLGICYGMQLIVQMLGGGEQSFTLPPGPPPPLFPRVSTKYNKKENEKSSRRLLSTE